MSTQQLTPEKHPGARVAEINWQDVEKRLEGGATGVLAVGAAAKAHGLHLPMNTDWVQAEWLSDRLIQTTNVLVWPPLNYGFYPAFIDYPGSCSLPSRIFQEVVRNILEDIYRAGAMKILIINTGISTIKPLQEAIEMFPESRTPALANIYYGRHFQAVVDRIQEQARGGHADELETSIMLAIAPESVDLSRAEPWDVQTSQPGAFRRSEPEHPKYSPLGICGDPTLASAHKGKMLLKGILDDLLELLG